jgi:hypothetical protein
MVKMFPEIGRDPGFENYPTISEITQAILNDPANKEILERMDELAMLKDVKGLNHADNV